MRVTIEDQRLSLSGRLDKKGGEVLSSWLTHHAQVFAPQEGEGKQGSAPPHRILNMAEIVHSDVRGLRALFTFIRQAVQCGSSVRLVGLSPHLYNLLRLAQFDLLCELERPEELSFAVQHED